MIPKFLASEPPTFSPHLPSRRTESHCSGLAISRYHLSPSGRWIGVSLGSDSLILSNCGQGRLFLSSFLQPELSWNSREVWRERENSHFSENVFQTISRSLPRQPLKSEPRPISVKDFPGTDRLADADTARPLLECQGLLSLGWQFQRVPPVAPVWSSLAV